MKQIKNYVLLILLSFLSISYADEIKTEDLSTEAKIDSIFKMQQQVFKERNISPLENKKYGAEFNFFRFLLFSEMQSFAGTFSLFDVNRNAEIAFPLYFGYSDGNHPTTEFNIDVHYRYFLGNNQKGFYLSGFSRYCLIDYYSYDDDDYPNGEFYDHYKNLKSHRFGLGIGLGYRIFSQKGLYWGVGLIFGRYFGNDIHDYERNRFFNPLGQLIIEIEFLKFGWAF